MVIFKFYKAWCFETINESYINSFNVLNDVNSELMVTLINISLAQAQECVLEKSVNDNRKNTIIKRISSQIEKYFELALASLESTGIQSIIGSRKNKVNFFLKI